MLGPIGFVRRYLRKFATWALLFSMVYLTYWAFSKSHLHAFWSAPGKGGFPTFGQAVDLVIGSVVSWTPLAADYTRFSKTKRGAALGAGFGYFVPTVWCIGLGILIVLARGVSDAQSLPTAVAAAGGVALVALLAITVDESEKAFADIYSTAVSLQNFLPKVSQRLLITIVTAIATTLALVLNLGNYQNFLYLLGSFFVPLFGVLVGGLARGRRALLAGADLRRPRRCGCRSSSRGSSASASTSGCRRSGRRGGRTSSRTRTRATSSFGASLPSFFASFAIALCFSLAARGSTTAVPAELPE